MLSILHRITGFVLALAAIDVVYWLYAIASGPETYANAQSMAGAWWGQILLLGAAFCLFYHFFNGIRHLIWDSGHALELKPARTTGYLVVVLALLNTALIAWMIYGGGA